MGEIVRTGGGVRRHVEEMAAETMDTEALASVIRAFDHWMVRAYCRGRFLILRRRFLDEIGQHLPHAGNVLDVGCGFGLFSLYFAQIFPDLMLRGFDINPRRIEMAQRAAQRLRLSNAIYEHVDATGHFADKAYAGAYMFDLIHHISKEAVGPLLLQVFKALRPGGRLVIKDVDTRPSYKRWFTHCMDFLVDPSTPVHYWSSEELEVLLIQVGFRVRRQPMADYLPYPHVLYLCDVDG